MGVNLLLTYSVTLGKLFGLSVLPFLLGKMGLCDNISIYVLGLLYGLDRLINVKCIEKSLAHCGQTLNANYYFHHQRCFNRTQQDDNHISWAPLTSEH